MDERLRTPPSLRRIAIGVLLVVAPALVVALLWLTRSHTIVYRVRAADCEARVEYSSESGRVQTTVRGARELGPFTLRHGDVANVLVLAGPDCRAPLRCEIIENGASVAVTHGDVAAICSASTAR